MTEPASSRVEIVDREEMHVAGLLLGRLLVQAERASPRFRLPASVAVDAGGMMATVTPDALGHRVVRGRAGPIAASLAAPLATFVRLAAGGNELRALLFGGLRATGDVRVLWALRNVLRAARRGS